MNIAIFSGLITCAKMMELGSKSLGIESPQESAQKLVAKISKTALGEEMTSRISNTNRTIPDSLKKLMRQCLFVSFLYTIDAVIKNSQKKDDEIQTPGIGINIASSLVASIFSGLIGGGINSVLTMIQSVRGGRPEGAVPSDGVAIEISSPRPANTVSADLVHIMPAPGDNGVNSPQPSPRQPSPTQTSNIQNNQNSKQI
jgi:hypothetical protein